MKRGRESEPFQEQEYLHFKHKVVKDRVRQVLYRPEGLTSEQERELLTRANLVELFAYFGTSLPLALKALGEFIQYSDSIINKAQDLSRPEGS